MKRTVLAVMLVMLASVMFAAKAAPAASPEAEGDKYYALSLEEKGSAKAVELADKAIESYNKALAEKETPEVYAKLSDAVEFKYAYAAKGVTHQQKWDAYKALIDRMDKYCAAEGAKCMESKHMVYALMRVWGRYGELFNVMEAATSGLAGKIKDYSEKLLELDRGFMEHTALAVLGRLHYKAPNIFLVLTWPDKNKSKEYLEEFLKHEPLSLNGRFFLAETLWDLGDKDRAKELFKSVMDAAPEKGQYVKSMAIKAECEERMKGLGLELE